MNFLTLTFLLFFSFVQKGMVNPKEDSVVAVLEKTAAELERWQSVRYFHQRDYNTGEQHFMTEGYNFIDFNSTDSLVGLKYQVRAGDESYIFNGTECFTINDKKGTLHVNAKPHPLDIKGGSFFYNSLVTLRRTLPLIAADPLIPKEVRDTLMNGKNYYLVQFSLFKKNLASFGGFSPITEERTFLFQLFIDKVNYLPFRLIQQNDADSHSSKVTYSNIEINPGVKEESWYYSTYLPQFKRVEEKEKTLLPVGAAAPPFNVHLFDNPEVEAQPFKGKVLVLEFWIRNCGPCIAAVPKLNRLAVKYKSRGVEVLAVNPVDNASTIAFFKEKYGPAYPMTGGGGKVADAFGVSAYPTVFILDKKGVIIYAGLFDEVLIEKTLEKAL